MESKNLTCIGCPLGCALEVKIGSPDNITVTGNTCPKGETYAKKEVTNPTRIVTSSVSVTGAANGALVVSCKTASDVPKDKIFDVVRELKNVVVAAPVHIGDVLAENIAGTGVDIIATKEIA